MTTTKSFGYYNFIRAMEIFIFNSPKGYSRKIINAQTDPSSLEIDEIYSEVVPR